MVLVERGLGVLVVFLERFRRRLYFFRFLDLERGLFLVFIVSWDCEC